MCRFSKPDAYADKTGFQLKYVKKNKGENWLKFSEIGLDTQKE